MNTLIQEVKEAVRQKYAWPGGYPLYIVMSDGGALCVACARKEWRNVYSSTKDNQRDGWKADGPDINWEDDALFCDHCSKRIESAYAEDENREVESTK